MAAAEYYGSSGGMPQAPQQQPPRPQHHQSQQNLAPLPYPVSDEPPPYHTLDRYQSHSQPPPIDRNPILPQGNGYQYPPPPSGGATHQYPPEKQGHYGGGRQNAYTPRYDGYLNPVQQQQPQQPQGQQGYPYPNGATPAMQQAYRDYNEPPGSSHRHDYRDDSGSRSRERGRGSDEPRKHHHHHHHHNSDRPAPKRNGSGVSTFLGAGAGSLIGDLIFPGMGTIGGAILGGVGGHKYAKDQRSFSKDREYYEENQRRGRRKHEDRY